VVICELLSKSCSVFHLVLNIKYRFIFCWATWCYRSNSTMHRRPLMMRSCTNLTKPLFGHNAQRPDSLQPQPQSPLSAALDLARQKCAAKGLVNLIPPDRCGSFLRTSLSQLLLLSTVHVNHGIDPHCSFIINCWYHVCFVFSTNLFVFRRAKETQSCVWGFSTLSSVDPTSK